MALVLLDVSNLIYRAFYSLSPDTFTRSDGKATNVVYGVANMILKVMTDLKKMYTTISLVACIDSPTCTQTRKEEQPEYKQTRQAPPNQLRHQFNWVKQLIDAMAIHKCEIAGYEADDIIASYVFKFHTVFDKIVIVSPDKDMYQLVSDNVVIYNPRKRIIEGVEEVKAKMGIYPKDFILYQSILGDKIDNVPGIKGIGPKTVVQIIETCEGSMNTLFSESFHHKKKTIIHNHKSQIESNMKVVTLKPDLSVLIPKNTFTVKQLKTQTFTTFLDTMEIQTKNLRKYALS